MKPKDLILKYISEMDSEMLSMVLSDDKTYQEATKTVFLEKLEELFVEFKENGETLLTPYNGTCGSEDCTNRGCTGYSFVGEASKESIDLIFDESEDIVKDIYNCNFMLSEYKDRENCHSKFLYVSPDEEAKYIPSPDYLYKVQLCQKAIDEISSSDKTYLTKDDYIYWLEKYKGLKDSLKDIHIVFNKTRMFSDIYFSFSEMVEFLEYEADAFKGLQEFKLIDISNETQLIQFLLKFEDIIRNLDSLIYFYLPSEEEPYQGFVEFKKKHRIYISVSDYQTVLRFINKFNPIYWETLEKYITENSIERSVTESPRLSDFYKQNTDKSI